jgi:acyl-coenzyme A synthetase/AMP-(fatty) acid ligase
MHAGRTGDICRATTGGFKLPKGIFVIETFSTTASGKVQKYVLEKEHSRYTGHIS